MKKKVFGALFAAVLVFSLVGVWPAVADTPVSSPGEYSGYSDPIPGVNGWVRSSQYVEVSTYRDSPYGDPLEEPTKLAIDIFRPAVDGVPVDEPYPVLFNFTPYRRAYYRPDGSIVLSGKSYADYFTQYGYVIVVADVRGMGASYGYRKAANDRIEAQDAHDLIEWLAAQSWCDGNVGMTGASYHGQTVLEAISTMPPHLEAAFIGITDFNKYDGWSRNGITRPSAAPVTPWQADLITLPVNGDTDGDGDGYPDMLYEACKEHQYNSPFTGLLEEIPYRDSYSDISESQYWEEVSASNYLDEIDDSDVPAYIYGGWYDFLRRDTIMTYQNWPNPKKMIVGPACHGGPMGISMNVERHRFFDYWLKGIDNGVMDEPPIYYAVMDTPVAGIPQIREWRFTEEWPLPSVSETNYYLQSGRSGTAPSHNDGNLGTTAPTAGVGASDNYKVDYTITTHVEPLYIGVPSGADGTEFDIKGLTYTTEPLAADMEVTGHPIVHLWVSSDNRDADIMVILEDVDPSGCSTYISDGRLRVSLRATTTPPYDFLGLPWHRCYQEDEQKLTPGEPVELVIDMMPTSYVFKEGHRIRLTIIGSLGKVLHLEPPNPDAPKHVKVYRNTLYPSHITLPVIE